MNLGGGGCSEPRSHHCTLAWHLATKQDSVSKKKKSKIHETLDTLTEMQNALKSLSNRAEQVEERNSELEDKVFE